MENITHPEGSKWWKWDLHCHTPMDKNWYKKPANDKEKKIFVKKYIRKAKSSDLKVLAITDHFDYKDIKDSYLLPLQKEAKKFDITILPGFEITAKEGNGIHLNVIFPEDLDLVIIQDLIKKLYPTIREAPPDAIPISKFNISEIYELLKDEIHDNFLLIFSHVDSDNGVLTAIKGANRISIWREKNVQFAQWTRNPFNYPENNFYFEMLNNENHEYHRKIAHIVASDCRSLESIPEDNTISYLGQKFTWIKTNPSFEGLKQIFYDPEFRIKFQDEIPFKENKQFFSKISLGDNQLFEDGKVKFIKRDIPLNRDMVAIIGSRGTGKSLLLDVLAKLHNKPSKFCENLEKINLNSHFTVIFNKEENIKIESSISNKNEIDYIHVNQAEVKKICEEPKDMNETIRHLIGIPLFSHTQELDDEILPLIDNYFELSIWLDDQDGNGNLINSEEFNKQRIKEYNNKIKYIKTIKSQEQVEKLRENERKIQKYSQAINELESLQPTLEKSLKNINNKLNLINSLAEDIEKIPLINYDIQINKIGEYIPHFDKKIQFYKNENEDIRKNFQKLGIEDIDFKMDQVKNYEKLIISHKNTLSLIEGKKKNLDKIFPALDKIIEKLLQKIKNYHDIIKIKWEQLKSKKLINEDQNEIRLKLLDSIEIKPRNYFDINEFYSTISENLNKTKFRQRGMETPLQRMIDILNVKNFNDYIRLIKNESIIEIEGESLNLKDFLEKKEYFNINSDREFLKTLYKSKYIQKYFDVISKTLFQNKEIGSLSMGERGTLFLRLKLATATFSLPFIFDQPEDDLDNNFIQNELVPLFRKIKNYRQLIIATHDANIVVNSNAEQIIIANNNKEELSYITGGLEDNYIRERICDILEGGQQAFEMRAKKYGLFP